MDVDAAVVERSSGPRRPLWSDGSGPDAAVGGAKAPPKRPCGAKAVVPKAPICRAKTTPPPFPTHPLVTLLDTPALKVLRLNRGLLLFLSLLLLELFQRGLPLLRSYELGAGVWVRLLGVCLRVPTV